MPTITMRDPKVQLELPNDLASDGGKEVVNFPPFKVRSLSSPPPVSSNGKPSSETTTNIPRTGSKPSPAPSPSSPTNPTLSTQTPTPYAP